MNYIQDKQQQACAYEHLDIFNDSPLQDTYENPSKECNLQSHKDYRNNKAMGFTHIFTP
jgi:hypothetical protein